MHVGNVQWAWRPQWSIGGVGVHALPARVILNTVADGGMHMFLAMTICSAVVDNWLRVVAEGGRHFIFHKILTSLMAATMLAPGENLMRSRWQTFSGGAGRSPFRISHNTAAPTRHRYRVRVSGRSWDRLYLAASDSIACLQSVAAVIRVPGFCKMWNAVIVILQNGLWNEHAKSWVSVKILQNTNIQESNQSGKMKIGLNVFNLFDKLLTLLQIFFDEL